MRIGDVSYFLYQGKLFLILGKTDSYKFAFYSMDSNDIHEEKISYDISLFLYFVKYVERQHGAMHCLMYCVQKVH